VPGFAERIDHSRGVFPPGEEVFGESLVMQTFEEFRRVGTLPAKAFVVSRFGFVLFGHGDGKAFDQLGFFGSLGAMNPIQFLENRPNSLGLA